MNNQMERAFAPAEAKYKAAAVADTWGHLGPKPREKYHGFIVWTHGDYGDITPIRTRFKDLPSSPWFFDDMTDFIADNKTTEEGNVYRFDGYYMKFKNGKCRFSGKIKTVPLG